MAKQDSSSYQKGWKSADFNMTTSPSVGRFGNDQAASLYVKGSSAKFDENDGRKNMAPYSNYGNLPQQASQQPASDIVDLRTAFGRRVQASYLFSPGRVGLFAPEHGQFEVEMPGETAEDVLELNLAEMNLKDNGGTSDWFLDSGASAHVTGNKATLAKRDRRG